MTALVTRPPGQANSAEQDDVAPPPRRSPRTTISAYVALTKPRVVELLLVTTIPVSFLASRGVPPLWPVLAVIIGGYLSAGSASAFNCYIDRDIDTAMRRTRRRPLPVNHVSARETIIFGVVLAVASTLWLGLTLNWLSSGLALAANLFYVFVYSLVLKRRTWQNTIWGGAAGCFPALIGWTAITGQLAWTPVVLFLVVFLWTPPHTWALAMRYREDYAAANVPMLPVVATERQVARQILWYTWATVAASFVFCLVSHSGPVYLAAAIVCGGAFLTEAYRLLGRVRAGLTGVALKPMRLFHLSNSYLALLFVAAAVDAVIFHGA